MNIQKLDHATLLHEPKPYTMIYNEVIQQISDPFAGFIWIYLQSLPPNWIVNKTHLMNHFDIGEDKYDKHIRYLKDHNLVEFVRERDDKGVFKRGRLHVLNGSRFSMESTGGKTPVMESSTGGVFHGVDNPGCGFYPPLINTITNTNTTKKKEITNSAIAPISEKNGLANPEFEYPDTLYPKKIKNKKIKPFMILNPHQIPENLLVEWMKIRRKPVTETVWEKLNEELYMCKCDPIDAFKKMICRGWSTVEAEWINKSSIKEENKTFFDHTSTDWIKQPRGIL
jgi:hypothetical protein